MQPPSKGTIASLEGSFKNAFLKYEVRPADREKISGLLERLKEKDYRTYVHSLRVALLAPKIASMLKLDERALFFAGALHDIGKIRIPKEILRKTKGLSREERKIMDSHPIYSYEILYEVGLAYSAEISIRHHRHQAGHRYPKKLPAPKVPFSRESIERIRFCSKMLAIADTYVAATNRPAKKHNFVRPLSQEEAVALLKRKFYSQKNIIDELYSSEIFRAKNRVRPVRPGRRTARPRQITVIKQGPGAQIMKRMRRR